MSLVQALVKWKIKILCSLLIAGCAVFYYVFQIKTIPYYPTTVSITVASGPKDMWQLFYDTGKYSYRYSHELSEQALYNGLDNQIITFKTPGVKINKFRIDPGQQKGIVKIKEICVEHNKSKKCWKGKELEKDFRPMHQIKGFKVENNFLHIESIGIDPHFELSEEISQYITFTKNRMPVIKLTLVTFLLLMFVFLFNKIVRLFGVIKRSFVDSEAKTMSERVDKISGEEEYRIFGNVTITKSELIAALISFFIILMAKGIALFNLTYAIDCYGHSITWPPPSVNLPMILSQGRFSTVFLHYFLTSFGIYPIDSFLFNRMMLIISFIIVALFICRFWEIKRFWVKILVITIPAIHPYTAELFTFNYLPYILSFGLITSFIGFNFLNRKAPNFIFGVCLIVISLGIYQTVLNCLMITIIFSIMLYLIKNSEISLKNNFFSFIKGVQFFQLAGVFVGVFLYLILNTLLLYIMGIAPTERAKIIGYSDFGNRVIQIKELMTTIFVINQNIFPQATKILIITLVAFTIAGIIWHFRNRLIYILLSLFLLFIAVLTIYGLNLPLEVWWPVPRVLFPAGFFLIGVIVVIYNCFTFKIVKNFITIISVIMIFSFVGVNNNIFTDQIRINKIDAFRANRLLARIEMHPNFSKMKKLAIMGGYSTYPIPVKTAIGDMNISAFCTSWAKYSIFKEETGFNFEPLTAADNKKIARYCALKVINNNIDTVEIVDDIGLLFLRK